MPAKKRKGSRNKTVRQPRVWLTPPRVNITPGALDKVLLTGADMEADLTGSIASAPLRATRQGPAQLTLNVADPDRELLSAGGLFDRDEDMLLDDNLDLEFGGVSWRLMGLEPDEQGNVGLAMEDIAGAWMRRHDRHLKAIRGRSTRAQFVHRMYREAGGGIPLYVPELHDKQQRAKSERPTDNATATPAKAGRTSGGGGWPSSSKPTVKHVKADAGQLRNLVAILEECRQQGCSRRVMIATVMCATQESVMRILNHGDGPGPDSRGLFQQRDPWGPLKSRMDAALSTRMFLLGGKGGQAGWKQKHGSLRSAAGDLNALIVAVQVSVGGYGQWEEEATRTVDSWLKAGGGAGVASTSGSTSGKAKAYVFERGQDGKREDSIICCNRLAEEVGWRHWIFGNVGVFASDEELAAAPTALTIHRDDEAVISGPSWRQDVRRTVPEMSCVVLVKRLPEPGQGAMIEDEGTASGLWLVDTLECDLARPVDTGDGNLALQVSLTFARSGRKKREPANPVAGSTTGTDQARSHGKLTRRGDKVTGGTLRERIAFAAEESARLDKSGQRKSFYSQGGSWSVSRGITGERKGQRSDCSQWVIAMFRAAGAKDPAGNSFNGGNTVSLYQHADKVSKPLPGDLCLYGPGGSTHAELYIGDGKTIGHGSTPVDYASPKAIPGFIGYYRPHVLKGET